jgi:hypothetical protein
METDHNSNIILMARKKLTRRYWLGELNRAKLERDNYIDKLMQEKFSGLGKYDGEAKLTALEFCDREYSHFIRNFETWINDNYPAPAVEQDMFDSQNELAFRTLRNFNQALKQAFDRE